MPNYQDGKIYTIRNYTDNEMIYVGSTTETLSRRLAKHRYDCKNGKGCSLYKYIVNDDWGEWYIELVQNFPCNSKEELEKREGEIIRQIGTINKCIAGRTQKEYRQENADKIKEILKKYYKENANKIKEQVNKYNENNADKIKEYKKTYREENADKIKKWRENNADIIKEKRKEKVCCNICGAFSLKSNLPRHQKSKKCMSKSLDNTDIPTDTHI